MGLIATHAPRQLVGIVSTNYHLRTGGFFKSCQPGNKASHEEGGYAAEAGCLVEAGGVVVRRTAVEAGCVTEAGCVVEAGCIAEVGCVVEAGCIVEAGSVAGYSKWSVSSRLVVEAGYLVGICGRGGLCFHSGP